jgi:hypothetical protein
MSRKAKSYEVTAMHAVRDEAREYVDELFPGAKVAIHIGTIDDALGVTARIEKTAPYTPQEIIACLSELGVEQVVVAGPKELL